ncbi:hypothetical protein MNEG_11459 [Monoraphidium neglectum]|uniref:Syntaxin 6/10/61 N-terminal domain-containing protein n=1 Tax=Monoraphidium neglectum TaxID=145388 RepID=A0A0D2J9R7_9CHLO|nr:hypothetical protein MNEG_11459 [Monoraphidium neglectum]KIY96502.1 hypothetical protein MNEG_11459 [Monoraphidium neglectum]|eukprot:XP_013895522.1 hypothetical protein MNEG_11459 [Monoraphidium neglectum]
MELEPADAPPRGPDPFNAAEEVVDRVLRHVQRLQSSAQAGDADAARRLPAALASLEDQLSALDAAVAQMARAPERFGLPPSTVRRRRELVEALRLEAAAVARAASGGAAATSVAGDGGGAAGRAGGGREASGSEEFQDVDLGAAGSGRLNGGTDTAKASRWYSDHISAAKQPQRQPPPSPPYSFNTRTAVPSNPAAAARRGGDQGSGGGGRGGGAYGSGSSGYGGGGSGRAYGGGGGAGDEEGYLHQEMQRHMMREQDEMLGDIEMQVGR